jgi:hypothetical protein
MMSQIKNYQEQLIGEGVDPNTAKQAAVVIANDTHGLPRTERGQRVVSKAHEQAFNK